MRKIIRNIKKAQELYHENGESHISDEEYDNLEAELEKLDPKNKLLRKVGSPVSGKKVKHKIPMLSMNKAKSLGDIEDWILKRKITGKSLVVTPKIDGISGSLIYQNGKLKRASTRGDGKTGQDISNNVKGILNVPERIIYEKDLEVRGEFCIFKNTIQNPEMKPLRNICSGILGRKEKTEDLQYVKFIAFQAIGLDLRRESSVFNCLGQLGFSPVGYVVAEGEYLIDIIKDYFDQYKSDLRERWKFETDGLVISVDDNSLHEKIDSEMVVNKYHHYNIALKPPPEGKETVAKRVLWQMSRQGNLIPVVEFDTVLVNGVNISRATLNNYENAVFTMKVKPGDKLFIERANDVIPFVKENLDADTKGRVRKPKKCEFCKSKLVRDGVHIRCVNKECKEIKIQKVIFWIKQSGVDGISSSTIRTLFKEKVIGSISDLYNIKESELKSVGGFQDKRVKNVLVQLEKSKRQSVSRFISMLGIPLVQERAVEKLGIKTLKDFFNFKNQKYVIGRNIFEWKSDQENLSLVKELVGILEIFEEKEGDKLDKTICFTGKFEKTKAELKIISKEKGFKFSDTFNKNLDFLVCDDIDKRSSKTEKAVKAGIKIISYDEFLKLQ